MSNDFMSKDGAYHKVSQAESERQRFIENFYFALSDGIDVC